MSTMKLRHVEEIRNRHAVEIAPSGDFRFPNATIEVRFLQYYGKDNNLIYFPHIIINATFKHCTIEETELWGDCLTMAAQIARRSMPQYISADLKDEIVKAWFKVDEFCTSKGIEIRQPTE